MKRKPLTHAARLLCALALSLSLAPAAFAADPSEPTQPSPCYPTAVTRSEDGTEIRKMYDLGPEDDPGGIPRSDFEQDGYHYTLTDLLKQELPANESRQHPETVSMNSKSKDMGAVLALLTGLCIFGGVRRISAITSGIVPVMAAIYIALGLFITVKNIGQVPYMLSMIVSQAFDPKAMFAGIGAFLSTFHQGSLGGMYGVLFGRPYILRDGFFIWPWTFFLYILSAVGSGPMFTVLVCTFMEKLTGRRLVSWDVKQLMGKIAGTMFTIYMVFKLADTAGWVMDILPRSGMTFDQMFHGWIYGKWLLFAELVVCGVLPAYLLFSKKCRSNPALFYLGGILACVGVTINRYVMTVQALAIPVMPFDTWEFYNPNWAEWGASFMVIAYSWLCLAISYRYLPMFPQERELNK